MGQPRGEPPTTTLEEARQRKERTPELSGDGGWARQVVLQQSAEFLCICQGQGTIRATAASGSSAGRVVAEVECDVMQCRTVLHSVLVGPPSQCPGQALTCLPCR